MIVSGNNREACRDSPSPPSFEGEFSNNVSYTGKGTLKCAW